MRLEELGKCTNNTYTSTRVPIRTLNTIHRIHVGNYKAVYCHYHTHSDYPNSQK